MTCGSDFPWTIELSMSRSWNTVLVELGKIYEFFEEMWYSTDRVPENKEDKSRPKAHLKCFLKKNWCQSFNLNG